MNAHQRLYDRHREHCSACDESCPVGESLRRRMRPVDSVKVHPCKGCKKDVVGGRIVCEDCWNMPHGTPGPPLDPKWCRACWGEVHIWLGNAWGLGNGPNHAHGFSGCKCPCHEGEVWLA